MDFPPELNARVVEETLPMGSPLYYVTLTFNGEDHTYTTPELSNFAAINILLRAVEDGYGMTWEEAPVEPAPKPAPKKTRKK